MKLIYFDVNSAVNVHDKIIKISGGHAGVKDLGIFESILAHIQNDDYYPSFEEKLTHLVFAVNKSHCFSDGNKRTSIGLGSFFLIVNGLDVFADKFIIEMENIAVAVADNIIEKDLLEEIIFSLINDEEYEEALQIKIIDALMQVQVEEETYNLGLDFFKDIF